MELPHFLLGSITVALAGCPALADPLHDAIEAGDIEGVRFEIASGAEVNKGDLMLGLPLMIAARGNHIDIAKALIAHGAKINDVEISGTALHAAAGSGHSDMIEYLVGVGAALNATPDGRTTPLHVAAENGQVERQRQGAQGRHRDRRTDGVHRLGQHLGACRLRVPG